MLRLETSVLSDGDRMVLPPRSLSEAVREAQVYALSGIPPYAQRGMTLAQALRYARQQGLKRPSQGEVQRSLLSTLRPWPSALKVSGSIQVQSAVRSGRLRKQLL